MIKNHRWLATARPLTNSIKEKTGAIDVPQNEVHTMAFETKDRNKF